MQETEKAYWAGLLDGEGHIKLYKKNRPRGVVQIVMTAEELLREFAAAFDLKCEFRDSPSVRRDRIELGHKNQWRVRAESRKAYKVLKLLHPYLKLKKPQAQEILAVYQNRRCLICEKPLAEDCYKTIKYCSAACRQKQKRFNGSEQRAKHRKAAKKEALQFLKEPL